MSLLYECINTVIAVLISISSGLPNHTASIQLCVQKLRILIEDSDQNLKYLGLLAMSKILKTHPKSVQAHKDLILACLDDKDESIRLRALDLLYGMVSKKNLMEIVNKLLGHMERAEGSVYRDELLLKVIEICSQESYQHVTNFEWYLTVLVELIQLETGSKHGSIIAEQLLDVTIRVESVRKFSVNEMVNLINSFPSSSQTNTMYEVLYAAAWIIGEFANEIEVPFEVLKLFLIERSIPGHIQAVFVQNSVKIFTQLLQIEIKNQDLQSLKKVTELMEQQLQSLLSNSDIEVQERASSNLMIVQTIKPYLLDNEDNVISEKKHDLLNDINDEKNGNSQIEMRLLPIGLLETVAELKYLFEGELMPVAPKAQRKVQQPDGLNLDEWINGSPSESSSDGEENESKNDGLFVSMDRADNGSGKESRKESFEPTPEEMEKIRVARKLLQAHNPNYLKSSPLSGRKNEDMKDYDNIDEIPIAELSELNLDVALKIHSKTKRSEKYLQETRKSAKHDEKLSKRSKKKSKKSKKSEIISGSESDEPKAVHIVNKAMELPEGASLSDNDDKNDLDLRDPHRALNINLEDEFYTLPSSLASSSISKQPPKDNVSKEKSRIKKKDKNEVKKKDKKQKQTKDDVNLLEVESAGVEEKSIAKSKKKSSKKDGKRAEKFKNESLNHDFNKTVDGL
jgi:AP-3 complex subunit delta-1